jgi:hypothetical protein
VQLTASLLLSTCHYSRLTACHLHSFVSEFRADIGNGGIEDVFYYNSITPVGKLRCRVCESDIRASRPSLEDHIKTEKHAATIQRRMSDFAASRKRQVPITQMTVSSRKKGGYAPQNERCVGVRAKRAHSMRHSSLTTPLRRAQQLVALCAHFASNNVPLYSIDRILPPNIVQLIVDLRSIPGGTQLRSMYLPLAYAEVLEKVSERVVIPFFCRSSCYVMVSISTSFTSL